MSINKDIGENKNLEQVSIMSHRIHGLEKLVSNFVFKKEHTYLYLLPSLFLVFGIIGFAPLIYHITFAGETNGLNKYFTEWYSRLLVFLPGYILLVSYLAYRLDKLVITHFIDSGITSYYWMKIRDDIDAVKMIYRGGFHRKNLPSPVTALIITLFTGGLGFYAMLYVVEKNLRDHCYGEEKIFLGKTFTNRIDASNLLIDIAATMLTLGLYISFWCYRVVKIYNKHVKIIHSNHPEPPVLLHEYEEEILPRTPILVIGIALLGAGIYGLLGLYKTPLYPASVIGYSSLLCGIALRYSRDSLISQVFKVFGTIYLVMISITLIGFIGAPVYVEAIKSMESFTEIIAEKDLYTLLFFIFINNCGMSIAFITPYLGPLYLGIGVSNAAFFIGVLTAVNLSNGRVFPPLVYIMPHGILELLGYAIFISLSTRIRYIGFKEFIKILIIGVMILFFAALVEALTIIYSKLF